MLKIGMKVLYSTICLSMLVGCSSTSVPTQTSEDTSSTGMTYADTISWDGQYDVVVAGFGGAGAVAAATAADAGANVLIVEKAPEGEEGGNTRYSAQLFVYGDQDPDKTFEHYQALNGDHIVDEKLLRKFTDSVADMYNVVENLFGVDQSAFVNYRGTKLSNVSPEYPELACEETISITSIGGKLFDAGVWKRMKQLVIDRNDSIDVWYESPAVRLIQDPLSKTILGVEVERNGEMVNIRANNGIVLATGGFENNPEMVQDYLGIGTYQPYGTLYNTGDGVTMAMDVGADLCHMEVYEGLGNLGSSTPALNEGERGRILLFVSEGFGHGSNILVGSDGTRFLKEDESPRHGHIKTGDCWLNPSRPLKSYLIWDQASYDVVKDNEILASATIYEANSIEELSSQINVDYETLNTTVTNFNSYAANGFDPEFGRSEKSMRAFAGDKYYAVEMVAGVLNTQGGPRKNENAEVLDVWGEVIPNLYAAGELGGITAFQYQGGGNIAECMIFGQIAGASAATSKEDLPNIEYTKQESEITYTVGVETDLVAESTADIVLADNQYLGVSEKAMGGNLSVVVTYEDEKITAVEIVDQHETKGIADPALEQLPEMIVEANSYEIDVVSQATVTSKAILEAVQIAVESAK